MRSEPHAFPLKNILKCHTAYNVSPSTAFATETPGSSGNCAHILPILSRCVHSVKSKAGAVCGRVPHSDVLHEGVKCHHWHQCSSLHKSTLSNSSFQIKSTSFMTTFSHLLPLPPFPGTYFCMFYPGTYFCMFMAFAPSVYSFLGYLKDERTKCLSQVFFKLSPVLGSNLESLAITALLS